MSSRSRIPELRSGQQMKSRGRWDCCCCEGGRLCCPDTAGCPLARRGIYDPETRTTHIQTRFRWRSRCLACRSKWRWDCVVHCSFGVWYCIVAPSRIYWNSHNAAGTRCRRLDCASSSSSQQRQSVMGTLTSFHLKDSSHHPPTARYSACPAAPPVQQTLHRSLVAAI